MRHEFGQQVPQPQSLAAQRRAHPVSAGRGSVAFVEDQVDHLKHRSQALRQLIRRRGLEGHARSGKRALGPHDALGDGRFLCQECARDLVGGESAEEAQGQCDTCLP